MKPIQKPKNVHHHRASGKNILLDDRLCVDKAAFTRFVITLVNLPNAVTLSRIPLMLVLVAFLAYPFPGARVAALLVFLFAAMTDWLDGWLARRMGQVSDFGKFMDALTDKIFTLGLFVGLLALLELQWALFPVLLILSREFLVTGLRLVASAQGVVLAAERAGKVKTMLQFCCLFLFLTEQTLLHDWELFFPDIETRFLLEWIHHGAVVTLILATTLTVTSGIGYMWRHVDLLFGENT